MAQKCGTWRLVDMRAGERHFFYFVFGCLHTLHTDYKTKIYCSGYYHHLTCAADFYIRSVAPRLSQQFHNGTYLCYALVDFGLADGLGLFVNRLCGFLGRLTQIVSDLFPLLNILGFS